ncbi:unnamed protein product, partial [Owenia fusiformis]
PRLCFMTILKNKQDFMGILPFHRQLESWKADTVLYNKWLLLYNSSEFTMSPAFYMVLMVTMVMYESPATAVEVTAMVSCANDRFTIRVDSDSLKIGKVYVEGHEDTCKNENPPTNNIGIFILMLSDKGSDCGVKEDPNTGKYKVTIRSESYMEDPNGQLTFLNPQVDKRWTIVCDFKGLKDGVVNVISTNQFKVSGDIIIENDEIVQPNETVVLEVLKEATGEVTTQGETLTIGTPVKLRITLTPSETAKGIQPKARCHMTDGTTNQKYMLTTSEGCPVPSNMLFKAPWSIHNYTALTSPSFQLPKFTSSENLVFICHVQYCPMAGEAECQNAENCGLPTRKRREAKNITKTPTKSDSIYTRIRVTNGESGLILCHPPCDCFKKIDVIASLAILGSLLLLTTALCLACSLRYRAINTVQGQENHHKPYETMKKGGKVDRRFQTGSEDGRSRRSSTPTHQSYARNSEDQIYNNGRGHVRY